jgi:hypothetical protein
MTEDCGRSPKKGEKLKVLEHLDGTPIVYGDNNLICSCQDKWELVEPELTLEGLIEEIEETCDKIRPSNKPFDWCKYSFPFSLIDKYRTQSPELKAHIKAIEQSNKLVAL